MEYSGTTLLLGESDPLGLFTKLSSLIGRQILTMLRCLRAVSSFNANGQKNGWPLIDASNDDQLNDIFNNGIRAVGVVQIPVCTADEAFNNWSRIGRISGGGLSDHFPCN